MPKFHLAALGGTFDHLHRGHQTLLKLAFDQAERVVVGLTQDTMVQYKTYSQSIEPFPVRLQLLQTFLGSQGVLDRVSIEPLTDLYGPTLTDTAIDCLVVSPLTKGGALVINKARLDRNLTELPVFVCDLERSQDDEHISSTRIRQGLIDREGFVYKTMFQKDLVLTEAQKEAVKRPLGELLSNPQAKVVTHLFVPKPPLIVAVGDATTHYLIANALHPDVAICDGKIQRQPIGVPLPFSTRFSVTNPAGTITADLASTITEAYLHKESILIEGEEDLALLPAIILAPLNSVIFYGQPNEGLVVVKVTEERKAWVKKLLTEKP